MKKVLLSFSVIFLSFNLTQAQVLNEIIYDPLGGDGGSTPGEWIEIFGSSGTDIGCFVITDGDWTVTIPSGTTIPASGFYVIGNANFANTPGMANGSTAVDLDVSTCMCTGGSTAMGLTNGGEHVGLFNASQTFVDGVIYGSPSASNLPSGTETTTAVGACPSVTIDNGAAAVSYTSVSGSSNGIARDADGTGVWENITGLEATPGSSNLSSLPISLVNFEATSIEEQQAIHLKWATASEENNEYFSIQHSTDGITFREVGTQDGLGNASVVNTYDFMHKNLGTGTHYYRLQQMDFDGTYEYTNVVTATLRSNGFAISVFPNPTVDNVNILPEKPFSKNAYFQLLNIQGQIVQEYSLPEDALSFELEMNDFAKGVYYIRLQIENEITTHKIVKQ